MLVKVITELVSLLAPPRIGRAEKLSFENRRMAPEVNFIETFPRRRQRLPPLLSGRVASGKQISTRLSQCLSNRVDLHANDRFHEVDVCGRDLDFPAIPGVE